MSNEVSQDHLVIIRIDGMHCAKCENAIQKALLADGGVHEVEVDFASGQASVLFDEKSVTVPQMLNAIIAAGYRPNGFTQRK